MIHISEDEMNCCGCGNCSLICPVKAISMVTGQKGFYIPKINMAVCINCNKCEMACPNINRSLNEDHFCRKIFAYKLKDKRKRMQCQSGGAFFTIADYVFSNYVNPSVYGVALNEKSMAVEYVRIDTPEDIGKLAGSKYVQANMTKIQESIGRDLKNGKQVLFSGTPCHVSAVRKYLELQKIDSSKLISVDILCHGVISQKIFKDYIDYVENLLGDTVAAFRFRDKKIDGWGGCYSTFTMVNGKKYVSRDYLDLYQADLFQHDSCYKCKYASVDRVSDITIGDYWAIGIVDKKFRDSAGVSCIISNTLTGSSIVETLENYGDILETSLQEAIQGPLQAPLLLPADRNPTEFWMRYYDKGMEGILKYKEQIPLIAGIPVTTDWKFIRNFVRGRLSQNVLLLCLKRKINRCVKRKYTEP